MFIEAFAIILSSMLFILAPFWLISFLISNFKKTKRPTRAHQTELKVSDALRKLDMKSYVIFDNVVLPSQGNTAHTEIDHIVVSPYGIFCVETKSHRGSIYAYAKNSIWTQYIGSQKHPFHSPVRQNYKHVKAIEDLLGTTIKAPIHSYVILPNATRLVTDMQFVYRHLYQLTESISRHKQPVYNLDECTRILKALAYASSQKKQLTDVHIQEVRAYLNTR